ncbi:hypothetical protein AOLI_G00209490 [Acnodon oligacanthus]
MLPTQAFSVHPAQLVFTRDIHGEQNLWILAMELTTEQAQARGTCSSPKTKPCPEHSGSSRVCAKLSLQPSRKLSEGITNRTGDRFFSRNHHSITHPFQCMQTISSVLQ